MTVLFGACAHLYKFQFRLSALCSKQENAPWCTGAAAPSLPPGVVLRAANQNPNDCRGQSYLNCQLSSAARLMRNGDTNRFRIRFVKKVLLETLYVLIYRCPISESVAVPHPPLRGTFPRGKEFAGESIGSLFAVLSR